MLIAQILAACSGSPQSGPTLYQDLNDSTRLNSQSSTADEVARTKEELTTARQNQERAAARQQALH